MCPLEKHIYYTTIAELCSRKLQWYVLKMWLHSTPTKICRRKFTPLLYAYISIFHTINFLLNSFYLIIVLRNFTYFINDANAVTKSVIF